MRRLRDRVDDMRATALGRAVLVVLVVTTGFAAWNLTARPYPDSRCDPPVPLVLGDGPTVPNPRYVTRLEPDREAITQHLDQARAIGRIPYPTGDFDVDRFELLNDPRFQREVRVLSNRSDLNRSDAAVSLRQSCLDELATPGFLWRGLMVPTVVVGVLVAGRFVLTPGRLSESENAEASPSDPDVP